MVDGAAPLPALVPGRPSRVVMATPDLAGTVAFYGGLLGWTAPGGSEGLVFFDLGGQSAAGVFQLPPEAVAGGAASRWLVYVTVRGIGAALGKVVPAGGQVLAKSFDLPDGGRMAVVADPTGAEFGLWQPPEETAAPADRSGAARPRLSRSGRSKTSGSGAEGAGTLAWAELYTRSRAQAAGFYEQVFGWEISDVRAGETAYMVATLNGVAVAGVMPIGAGAGDMPSHWMPYFAVADTDAAATRADSLGGEVCAPPEDTPSGRLAVLRDPHGALFFVVAEKS